MELSREEFTDILKFYRVNDKLEFIGYHEVDPDTFWYFSMIKSPHIIY